MCRILLVRFIKCNAFCALGQEDDQSEKVEPYMAADELRIPVGMVLVSELPARVLCW